MVGGLEKEMWLGAVCPMGTARYVYWGKIILSHRLAWLLYYKEWPSGDIDHKNRNKSDNRINNLRIATDSENRQNSIIPLGKSGLRGVSYHKHSGKWRASIEVDKKKYYLGYFSTKEEAFASYEKAKKEKHPAYAEDCMRMITETMDAILEETTDAILVLYEEREIWLPKSAIDMGDAKMWDEDVDIDIAKWLALKEGMI